MTAQATAPARGTTTAPAVRPSAPLLDSAFSQAVSRLDQTALSFATALAEQGQSRLVRSMILSEAIEKLKGMFTRPIMDRLMSLMNSELGFKTDRTGKDGSKAPYSDNEVRDAVVAGLLQGVYPLGNEMNIIAGRCYVTKEGYQRKLRELPGLTDLIVTPGIPRAAEGQTVVRVAVRWKYRGVPAELLDPEGKPGLPIAVPVHSSTGVDAVIGKATRKALKRVYEQITGSQQGDDDLDGIDPPARDEGSQDPPAALLDQPDPPPADELLIDDLMALIDQANAPKAVTDASRRIGDLAREGRLSAAQQQQLSAVLEKRLQRK